MDDGEESGGVEVDVETDGFLGFDCEQVWVDPHLLNSGLLNL